MCGIAGAVGFIDDTIREAVRDMDRAQVHRGPDGQGYWSTSGDGTVEAAGVVFAHRRLAILDLSPAGAQPMEHARSGNVLTYNGEVYGFDDVRKELANRGHEFRSTTDSEVVLAAMSEWGPEALGRFTGMYDLALWDPSRRIVHLARDPIGIKPLYWMPVERTEGSTVLFATELRAVLASGLASNRIHATGIGSFLWHGFVAGSQSLIDGVFLLDAGTCLTIPVDDPISGRNSKTFWSLPNECAPSVSSEELQSVLQQSVANRLVADVPVGVFLSGGIDSSAVAALAAKASSVPVRTFNIGFESSEYDESEYARRVAAGLGTDHTCCVLTEGMFRKNLETALDAIDQPTFDGINTYFVSRAVREAGITVALAGVGGDELFGGYTSFTDVPRVLRWFRRMNSFAAPKEFRDKFAGLFVRILTGSSDVPPQTRWGKLRDVFATDGDLARLYQVSYSIFTEQFQRRLNEFGGGGTQYGLDADYLQRMQQLTAGRTEPDAIAALELASFIGQRLLRDVDAASMRVALELRVPLLDHRFVESVGRVPDERRFLPMRRKQLLRDIALQELDPQIFERPKSGFVLPIEKWCRAGLNDHVKEVFYDASAAARVGLNSEALKSLWKAFSESRPGIYWSRIWALYVLMRWSSRHGVSV